MPDEPTFAIVGAGLAGAKTAAALRNEGAIDCGDGGPDPQVDPMVGVPLGWVDARR